MILPLAGYVLIKDKTEEKIGSFVIVSDEKDREATVGEILNVGERKQLFSSGDIHWVDCQAKTGDKVVYMKYHGHSVADEGVSYKLVDFTDIIAIIK